MTLAIWQSPLPAVSFLQNAASETTWPSRTSPAQQNLDLGLFTHGDRQGERGQWRRCVPQLPILAFLRLLHCSRYSQTVCDAVPKPPTTTSVILAEQMPMAVVQRALRVQFVFPAKERSSLWEEGNLEESNYLCHLGLTSRPCESTSLGKNPFGTVNHATKTVPCVIFSAACLSALLVSTYLLF